MATDSQLHVLLYKVAQAYYIDGLTQQQIARRLGFSRAKVSRLLSQAKDERIVTISVAAPTGNMVDLEKEIEATFALEEAVVVSVSDPANPAMVARDLAPAAANCLVRRIRGNEVIGITWGSTMMALVDALAVQSWSDVTIVQLNGGLGPVGDLDHSIELARRMARKLSANLRLLSAPGIVSSAHVACALKSDTHIAEALALAAASDLAVVGMGVLSSDSVLMRDGTILSGGDCAALERAGAVGDIALRYIGRDGEPLALEINERIIGLTFDQIRNIPQVIGVAGGVKKYDIIRAALRSKLLNVLVTDHVTAQRLIEGNQ
jgi:DNA-binding transcriptional regulator LsrR (DeoR family)